MITGARQKALIVRVTARHTIGIQAANGAHTRTTQAENPDRRTYVCIVKYVRLVNIAET